MDSPPTPIGTYKIRNAAVRDLSIVKALYQQLAPEVSHLDRDFSALLSDPNALCLILEERARPIGTVICYVRPSLSSGRKMVIDDIVIDADHRGRGYGRALMRHCISLAKGQGLDCVELSCSLTKPELHRFYEDLGFRYRMRHYSLFLESQ